MPRRTQHGPSQARLVLVKHARAQRRAALPPVTPTDAVGGHREPMTKQPITCPDWPSTCLRWVTLANATVSGAPERAGRRAVGSERSLAPRGAWPFRVPPQTPRRRTVRWSARSHRHLAGSSRKEQCSPVPPVWSLYGGTRPRRAAEDCHASHDRTQSSAGQPRPRGRRRSREDRRCAADWTSAKAPVGSALSSAHHRRRRRRP